MNNCLVWEQETSSCKDSNNEESIKLSPEGEIEPKLKPQQGYKVVFQATKILGSLAQWLITQLTSCQTLLDTRKVTIHWIMN